MVKMQVLVNRKPEQISEGANLNELLAQLGLGEKKGIAIAVNQAIKSRDQYSTVKLVEGDQIIIIQAAQGG